MTASFDSCFERLGGYLTILFKQVLKNLPLFREAECQAEGKVKPKIELECYT